MAQLTARGGPKIRERKDGAAVALDELDKKLLNLMQGRFPLEPRPYARVAELAEVSEDEVMRRVQRLLDERIIRQVTPIFDTRALGYSSMLVAAKVDGENPHRPAQVVNAHPGVSHNYLRNHDFNLWFTIATEPDSKLGLEGTLEPARRGDGRRVGAPAAHAAALQDPHGPGDGGRHPGAGQGRHRRAPARARADRAPGPGLRGDQDPAGRHARGVGALRARPPPSWASASRLCWSISRR